MRSDHWIEGALTILLSLAPPKAFSWLVAKRPFLLATLEQRAPVHPYLPLTVGWWLRRGKREEGRRERMSGFCHRIFRALYSAASEGPSPSHAASAPFPNTAVFLRGRHRAEPRNWISAPCDTSAWPLKRGFIVEINRLLLGTWVLCLSGQSYLSARAGEKNRVCLMALTLCHFQGRKNGKVENPKSGHN